MAAVFGGHVFVRRLEPAADPPTRLAWAWLLGQGLVSFGAVLAVTTTLPLALAVLAPLGVAVAVVVRERRSTVPGIAERGRSSIDPAMLVIASIAGLIALALVWRSPGLGWDGQAIWALKARVLAETGQLPIEMLRHATSLSMHPEYPLHVPLLGGVLGGLVIELGGEWSDRVLPLLDACNLLAIAILLAGALQSPPRAISRVLLAGGLLTPIVWQEVVKGQADVTLALCLLASTLALSRWLETGAAGTAYLAALAAGLGAFTKQEGAVWLVLSFFVAGCLAAGRRRQLIGPLLLALSIALPWHLFRFAIGLETESFALSAEQLERLPPVLGALFGELIDYADWGLLWLAVPAVVWLELHRLRDLSARLLVAGLGTIVLMFVATPHDLTWHLSTALDRLVMQWWPVAILVLAGCLSARAAGAAGRDGYSQDADVGNEFPGR